MSTPSPFYASAGPRRLHIIHPNDRTVMLCSAKLSVITPEFTITEHGTRRDNGIRNFPTCKNCQKKADKLGIVEGAEPTPEPVAHVVEPPSENEFVTVAADGGKVHHARADDDDLIPLCRESRGIRQHTLWHRMNAPLSCSHCLGYEQGRAIARAKYNATLTEPTETVRVGTSSDTPELVAVCDLLNRNGYEPVTLKANPTLTVHGTGYFINPAWDGKIRLAMLTDDPAMHGRDLLPQTWRDILTLAGYRIAESHPNALILQRPTSVRPGHGTAPEHADDPRVRAILADLEKAGVPIATVPTEAEGDPTVNGAVAVPRPGLVCVYFYTHGNRRTIDDAIPHQVQQIRQHLTNAGWQVSTDTTASLAAKVMDPAPACTYITEKGWSIGDAEPLADFRAARDVLIREHNQTFQSACSTLDRAHIDVLNTQLPPALEVGEDDQFGGFMYLCMGGRCKRSGAHDSPGGAAMFALIHREHLECLYHDHTQTLNGRVISHQGTDHDPDTAVHYRASRADHGAVCGITAFSATDPGMSVRPDKVTCVFCRKLISTTPAGLPRRTSAGRPSAIEEAARRLREAGTRRTT